MENNYVIPSQPQQLINNDDFLELLNCSQNRLSQESDKNQNQSEMEAQCFFAQLEKRGNLETQWTNYENQFDMKFENGIHENNNPFFENIPIMPIMIQRDRNSDSFYGAQQLMDMIPLQVNKKEQEIILNNRELFKANQSKSIYLSKISTLIDRTVSPSHQGKTPSSPSSLSKVSDKILRKASQCKQDSDSSSDQKDNNNLQQKLAKNRESARNSRKRKKVYVELLENKVSELSDQVNALQTQCANQKIYIENCQNAHLKVQHLFFQELQAVDEISNAIKLKQPIEPVIRMIEFNIGVASNARTGACDYFMDGLLDCIQTNASKFFCESAEQCSGLFNQSALMNSNLLPIQEIIAHEYSGLKHGVQSFYKQYQNIRKKALEIEILERQIIQVMTPILYAQQILCVNASLMQKFEQDENPIKMPDYRQMRKQIKTF